jgi:hypothetical protein
VSIGFRQNTPPPPPDAVVLWVCRKGKREARAVVRLMPHGRELRILVDGEMGWTRLYRNHEADHISQFAEGALAPFISIGWVRVEAAGEPTH